MHANPIFQMITGVIFIIIFVGLLAKIFKFPNAIAYLLTGILLGPSGLGFIQNTDFVKQAGDIGVTFLMFFIGMEFSLSKLAQNWKVSFLGTTLQIIISTLAMTLIGSLVGWDLSMSVLMGFVVSLSSTAMVIKLVQEKYKLGEVTTNDIISILISQDIALIPMLIIVGYLEGSTGDFHHLAYQLVGGATMAFLLYLSKKTFVKKMSHIKILNTLRGDTEYQVFISLGLCMGLATVALFFHLSEIIGALVAGMMISQFESRLWVYNSLKSLKIILIALFFTSIGMLIDFNFFFEHLNSIILLTLLAFFLNTVIIAGLLKALGRSVRQSFKAAAILSQIGELSFILATVGHEFKIFDDIFYHKALNTISLSILLTPLWVNFVIFILSKFYPNEKLEI